MREWERRVPRPAVGTRVLAREEDGAGDPQFSHAASERAGSQAEGFRGAAGTFDPPGLHRQDPEDVRALDVDEGVARGPLEGRRLESLQRLAEAELTVGGG